MWETLRWRVSGVVSLAAVAAWLESQGTGTSCGLHVEMERIEFKQVRVLIDLVVGVACCYR